MRKRPFPLERLGRDAIFTVFFCLGCAVLICLVIGSFADFIPNLVVALCIGLVAVLLIDAVRLTLWGEEKPMPKLALAALVAVTVPIAHFAGNRLASLLLGFDTPVVKGSDSAQSGQMLVFTLLVTCVAVMFFISRDRLLRAERAAAQERARSEAVARTALQSQLQLLQAQIEPHMLFNTLANLQGMIGLDPDRAQHMLDQLIQYLRASLNSSRAEVTTLGREFALMEAYLGLMAVRMGTRLTFSVDLAPGLAAAALPPMLLQPLVENAITHGLEPKVEGGHVHVAAARQGDLLVISVTDNGLGLDAAGSSSGTRVGVANTQARLAALFGDRGKMTLEPNPAGGAVARLALPMDIQ